jgi:Tfp pilus assembly protein PilN
MLSFDSALGVEIRGNTLVLAAVTRGVDGVALKSHRTFEGFVDLERAELQRQVLEYVRTNGINKENVVVGVPRDAAVVQNVELPLDVEENLSQVVEFQASRLRPSDEIPSVWDYVVLDRDEKAKQLSLQIVLIPQIVVDESLELLGDLDLYPASVRLSSYGLQQIFKYHQAGYSNPAIILAVDDESVEIVVVDGPTRCYSHKALHPDRRDFDSRLGRSQEIELLVWATPEITLNWVLEEVSTHISRLRLPEEGFSKIFVTGSREKEFLPSLQEQFLDVESLSDGLKVKVNGTSRQKLTELSSTVGLALSGVSKSAFKKFNLIPVEKRIKGERPSLAPTIVLLLLVAALGIALAGRGYFQQNQLLVNVSSEVERLKPEVERALQVRSQMEERAVKAQELEAMLQGRQAVLEILRDLTERIPEDTYLQSMNIRNGQVSLTGLSESASGLINILSESVYLDNVESRYITRDAATGKNKFNFEARVAGLEGLQ